MLRLPWLDCAENSTIHFLTLIDSINNQTNDVNFIFSQTSNSKYSLYEELQTKKENERVEVLL